MSKEIVICTSNQGKIREFAEILDILAERSSLTVDFEQWTFKNLKELEIDNFEVDETEDSYIGNARLKALAGAKLTGKISLADDSGIEVEALDGAPGIYSGRYLREENRGLEGLLKEMATQNDRNIRYVCALVLASPEGEILFETHSYWYGELATEKHGEQGFGFDPIVYPVLEQTYEDLIHVEQDFLMPIKSLDKNKTVAQMTSREKNSYSHRFKSVRKLLRYLQAY